jgi:HSP20 family protein
VTEENGKRFHPVERAYGRLFRSFTLQEDDSKAELKNGMPVVPVPKELKPQPKAVEVKIA